MATNCERATILDARRRGGFRRYATAAAALTLIGAPIRAMAQSSSPVVGDPSGDAHADASTLNEVVVTAQKRSERVQDVPLSITAYSGDALIQRGITNISKLGYETPGVSERNSGPGQTEYEMRGIASSGGQSPTVGFYLDETPLTPAADAQTGKVVIDPSLYDLSRVEVLRGPQGTLYGSGSMGGTIKLVTNQPDPKAFYGSAEAITSDTQSGGFNYGLNAMLNIPLVEDKAALRIVATDKNTDGWIDRTVLSSFPLETNGGGTRGDVANAPVGQTYKNVNSEQLTGGRATLLVKPVDRLTITAGIFYQRIGQDGLPYSDSSPTGVSPTHYEPLDVKEPFHDTFTLYTLKAQYDFDTFDVTSATAEFVRQSKISEDSTEPAQQFLESIIGIPDVPYAAVGPLVTYELDESRQFTQELRITSKGAGPFQWLIGGFYQKETSTDDVSTNTPGPLISAIFGVPSLYNVNNFINFQQYAAFGEASYRFLDRFKATLGLRYYSYNDSQYISESGGLVNGSLTPTTYNLGASYSGLNPKFNLSYEASRDLLIYAEASKGFRPGSGNQPPPTSCSGSTPLQYGPDSLWSYELGEKAQLFQKRLTANAAVYYEDWSGIQQTVTETCGFSYTGNAGSAGVYGAELELTGRVTPEITLSNSAGYTHASISSAPAGSTFFVGEKIQDVPSWTNTTSISYSHPVSQDYDFVARATNQYTGSMIDVSYGLNAVPARDLVDVRAGLVNSKYSIFLYIDNLTDSRVVLGNAYSLSFNPSTFNRALTAQPRTIGLDLNYRFGAGR